MKTQTFNWATIKIRLDREIIPRGSTTEYKDKLWCADIVTSGTATSFCQPTLKDLFKEIKDTLYV
mgnify:CR=1 FL=1